MVEQLIRNHYAEAHAKYPNLHPPVLDGNWRIVGSLAVIDDTGHLWDDFRVCITLPTNYPIGLPTLSEISNKIPKHEDWHNGDECCLGTEAKLHRELAEGITLTRWLDRHVIPYLANYLFRKKTDRYANGEFAHQEMGILEYYLKIFELHEAKDVVVRISHILGYAPHSKNTLCFCGSGKLYKRCFLVNRAKHQLDIPLHVFQNDLSILKKWISRKKLNN